MPVPAILLIADVLTGTLQFSKGQAILPAIVFILGLLRYRATRTRLVVAAIPILLMFQVLVPTIQYGRAELQAQYGNIDSGSLSDRLDILSRYAFGNTGASQFAQTNSALERFYYAPTMAAAVVQYDSGQYGESLLDVFTVFIPRFIWPNKPVYNVGARFNLAVANSIESASWMGIYTEAYWNLGWLGLPVIMIPLALAYWALGRLAIIILKQAKWLHFPVAFLAAYSGMRIDGDIVSTQVVSIFLCFALHYGATIMDKWLSALFSTSGGSARNNG